MRLPRALFRDRHSCAALAIYLITAFLYFGLRLLVVPGNQYVGEAWDQKFFIWAIAWWPHAILHGVNPFFTHALWAPDGVNLAWVTSVPAIAVPFAPLTLVAGPFVTYNVVAVLMPALSAWTAFLLCRYLTHAVGPALVGGYLFGFSTFELAHVAAGHLPLTSAALLPLAALLILRFLDGNLTGREFVVRFGPLLALELLLSTEVALTLSLSVAVAILLGFALVPERRPRLVGLVPFVAWSYLLAALLTAPFVYYVLAGFRKGAYNPPDAFHADLLNLVVPTRFELVGGHEASSTLPAIGGGEEAYVGVPALLVVALFAYRAARTPSGRFVLASFAVAVIASLGAYGNVDGHRVVTLPWALVHRLPLFDNVLTVRLAVYVSLVTAVAVALWAARHRAGVLRYVLPTLAVVAIVPSPTGPAWTTPYNLPPFLTPASFRFCRDSGENILPLPIGQGDAMLWQVESKFRFNIAGGYVGAYIPPSFLSPPGIAYVTRGYHLGPEQTKAVKSFITAHGVTSAVVVGYEGDFFRGALDRLATPTVGGVLLYHFSSAPPSCLGP
jgi:hypothetical protein